MKRTADYTIEGFIYQFNKTLVEILRSENGAEIMVEGIIEDIDVITPNGICAIQCKYHESQQKFNLSAIYKPLLQMMCHFVENSDVCITYKLYAHFPNETGSLTITKQDLETILTSKDKELHTYIEILTNQAFDFDKFLDKLTVEFGESLENLTKTVRNELVNSGMPNEDIDTLVYPNAVNEIAKLSIQHNKNERIITKDKILKQLRQIRSTAISRWTLSLRTYKKILEAKKKQLKPNLDKNSRLRHFVFCSRSIVDFDEGIVNFIQEYIEKYHFKEAHISTPLFCLDCSAEQFKDIRIRLHKKDIRFNDGFIVDEFDRKYFFRDPIVSKQKGTDPKADFRLRIVQFDNYKDVRNERVCDDLFIVSDTNIKDFVLRDVNTESLGVNNFQELKFLLGMSAAYE